MSLENEDRSSPDKATETSGSIHKRLKISYTREFLLSLSELDVCKKLPIGFDESLLSEFEDTSHSIQDRQRLHGSSPLQGFRRSEYGSSPPTRGDSSNYSRGIYGRWDSRSSGRGDRDSDSQSDRESDSGRRYGNQSRKSWQGPEHDGLLGSGSFPRPSGYGAGISAPKVRANDNNQLNRSNEPYNPPRSYKAAPLSRRDTSDSYNDETFGSTEYASEDRAEEERRRRVSFELMRKEQQKSLQEKQKMNQEKHKVDSVSEISELLDDGKEEKRVLDKKSELDATAAESASIIDTGRSVLPSQTPTCRPLVPPGFTKMASEKNCSLKSLIHSNSTEVGKNETEECILHASVQRDALGGSERPSSGEITVDQESDDKNIHLPFVNRGEQIANSSSSSTNLGSSSKKLSIEDFKHQTSMFPEAHEALDEPEIIELNSKVSELKTGSELNQNDSTSILDKIFGNVLTANLNDSVGPTEHHDKRPGEMSSPKTVHSSKFARWFVEDERKTDNDLSSGRPNDLLSLIVGTDKGRSHVSDIKPSDHYPREFSHQSSEVADKSTADLPSAANVVSQSLPNCSKQEVVPSILTCEDLEQTILSEFSSDKSSDLPPPLQGWSVTDVKSERQIDDHASQHLLSLLQKGSSQENTTPKFHADIDPSEEATASDLHDLGAGCHEIVVEAAKDIHTSGNSLTLETLFGTAFMKELQSVEAPISIQRGSIGSSQADALGQQELSFPLNDNGLFPSAVDQRGSQKTSNAKTFLTSNYRQQTKLDKNEKWLGYDDPQIEMNLPKHQPNVGPKHGGFGRAVEYQLPEEESLIASANEELNPQLLKFLPGGNSSQTESLPSNVPGDIVEKLAAIIDERSTIGSDGPPFVRGPYNQMELDNAYRDVHAQTSSPHFQSMQMNQGRQLLQSIDSHPSHMNSHMKFMTPESMIQHDAPANQQFPANMLRPPFHPPNVGLTGLDIPSRHRMLQQMQMHGKYPPHLVNDLPRGSPVPHLSNQATGFVQEVNPMPRYPLGPRQPNLGGLGMPIPAPDINGGTNHPEAFQRLVEMELRANAKQIPPFAVGRGQGIYGDELDIMRYR